MCVIAFIMVALTIIQYAKRKITMMWALFWSALWIIAAVSVFFSGWLDVLGQYIINDTGKQFAVYSAIIVLFVIVYRLFLSIQKLDASITKLVEELAKKKR